MTKTVIPTSAVELEEMLGDRNKIQNMLRDEPASFSELVQNYARAVAEKDQSQAQQVREQVQATLADWFRDNPDALASQRPNLDPNAKARSRGHLHNADAPGAALDGQFSSVRDMIMATYGEKRGTRADVERLHKIRNDFSSHIPESGGLLIPEEFRSEMLHTMWPDAVVRPRARVIPMAVPRVEFPMIEDTDHRTSAGYYGGIITHWTGEADELTASAPKWGKVTLDSNDLTAYTEVPNQLLADSAISLTGFIEGAYPDALRDSEDEGFLWGDGVGKPLGALHASNAAAVTVAKESGQPNDTIVWENIIKMYSRMLPSALSRAVWVINPECLPELMTMALSVGTGGSAVFHPTAQDGPNLALLGRPIKLSEKAGGLGDIADVSFVDFGHYLIGDRQEMSASWSDHFKFNTNVQAFRIIQRLAGTPWLKNPITPRRGTATLSPYVKLGAR